MIKYKNKKFYDINYSKYITNFFKNQTLKRVKCFRNNSVFKDNEIIFEFVDNRYRLAIKGIEEICGDYLIKKIGKK